MPVTIQKMTTAEFEHFYQWSAGQRAEELMHELHLTREEANREAINELSEMLPQGQHTENNHFMTVTETENGASAGFIWTIHEHFEGRKQSFLCDFAIWEAKRRRGYAAAALNLAEQEAVKSGCRDSVLFVRDDNVAAAALYAKCGYHVLRQAGSGKYMIKHLV